MEVGELEVAAPGQDGFDEVGLGDANAEVVVEQIAVERDAQRTGMMVKLFEA